MERNLIGAPWKKSHSLGEMVKAQNGDLVAVVYGRTADERRARSALVEKAPRLLEALKNIHASLSPEEPMAIVLAAVIAEAEPL